MFRMIPKLKKTTLIQK